MNNSFTTEGFLKKDVTRNRQWLDIEIDLWKVSWFWLVGKGLCILMYFTVGISVKKEEKSVDKLLCNKLWSSQKGSAFFLKQDGA